MLELRYKHGNYVKGDENEVEGVEGLTCVEREWMPQPNTRPAGKAISKASGNNPNGYISVCEYAIEARIIDDTGVDIGVLVVFL